MRGSADHAVSLLDGFANGGGVDCGDRAEGECGEATENCNETAQEICPFRGDRADVF